MENARYSCQILMVSNFLERFSKNTQILNFIKKNPSIGSRAVPCGQTERHNEANRSFRNFANMPKTSVYRNIQGIYDLFSGYVTLLFDIRRYFNLIYLFIYLYL
jgi:hypothetical protein